MNPKRAQIAHWLALTLSLLAILVCAHLLRLHVAQGDVDCLGQKKEVITENLFDCRMAVAADPLGGTGHSLAQEGFLYCCGFTLLLLMRLQWPRVRALPEGIELDDGRILGPNST